MDQNEDDNTVELDAIWRASSPTAHSIMTDEAMRRRHIRENQMIEEMKKSADAGSRGEVAGVESERESCKDCGFPMKDHTGACGYAAGWQDHERKSKPSAGGVCPGCDEDLDGFLTSADEVKWHRLCFRTYVKFELRLEDSFKREIAVVNRKLALRQQRERFRSIGWSDCTEADFDEMQDLLEQCVEMTNEMPELLMKGRG